MVVQNCTTFFAMFTITIDHDVYDHDDHYATREQKNCFRAAHNLTLK